MLQDMMISEGGSGPIQKKYVYHVNCSS